MITRFRASFASLAIVAATLAGTPSMAQELQPLSIRSGEKVHAFKVELADTPAKQQLGLMNRESMPADQGMLFDFGEPREANMYMKNTLIPLDMLFFGPDGKVLAIAENARPHSLRLINPGIPVKGVLELNGGATRKLGIKPGDVIEHAIIPSAASASAARPSANGG